VTNSTGPRVLLLEGALRDNGGLRVNHGLVKQWAADGVPAMLLVLENVAPDVPMFAPDQGVPWTFASTRVRRFRVAVPFVLAGLVRYCRRADVVISGGEVGWQLIFGRIVTRLLRKPFVTLVQARLDQAIEDWQPAKARPLLRWAHRHVDRAICVAPGLVDPVVAGGLPADRVGVVPVGIDVDAVVRSGAAGAGAGSDSRAGAPVLVAVGRLVDVKGFDVLVEASARLLDQGLPHAVRIIGEGPERAALADRIRTLGLQDVIELVGFVHDPQPLLAAADVFVLPSRHEGNGSLALLEALAHGRPVVASDCESGPREVLREGALGDLVPPGDAAALAGALARHLRDPRPLLAKAAGGPARARDFDQAASARALLRHLERTIPAATKQTVIKQVSGDQASKW
jgi:glycosyltransferase involved in cell wall biosynthesis